MWNHIGVSGGCKLKRRTLKLQAVWKPPAAEDDLRLSSLKRREKNTWPHLLRQRGTLLHTTLLHGWQLQTGLIFSTNLVHPSLS
jgi:hypothetical protein